MSVAASPIGRQCAALGAAALAAVGTGLWRDFSPVDACASGVSGAVARPDPAAVAEYRTGARRFAELTKHLAAWGDAE